MFHSIELSISSTALNDNDSDNDDGKHEDNNDDNDDNDDVTMTKQQ